MELFCLILVVIGVVSFVPAFLIQRGFLRSKERDDK